MYHKTQEIRNHKETAMKNLQQKIEKIEDERQHIRRKITKLNEKLEGQTRTGSSLEEQLHLAHLCTQGLPPDDTGLMKNRLNGNVATSSRSQVPRFMRSTICSRSRKTGTENQTPVISQRRRSKSSRRAESVSFPVKNNNSECNSDRSISRSTCVVGLNRKNSIDNETVCSQDTSECDIKMVVSQVTSNHQRTSRHLGKNKSVKSNKCNSAKGLKVDQWLDLHKDEPAAITDSASTNKSVLDIPIPNKKHTSIGQKKVDKPPTLQDLFAKEYQEDSVEGLSIEENQDDSLSAPDSCWDGLEQSDDYEIYATPMVVEAVKEAAQCSDSSRIKINSRYRFSPSVDLDNSISNSQEICGVPEQALELEWYHKQVMVATVDGGKEDDMAAFSTKELRKNMCRLKSQSALHIDDMKQKDHRMTLVKSREITQNEGKNFEAKTKHDPYIYNK